MCNRQCCGT